MLDKEIQHEVHVQTRVCQVNLFHLTLWDRDISCLKVLSSPSKKEIKGLKL